MSNPRRSGPTMLQLVVGRRLRNMREAAGITADTAAAAVHKTAATVTRMEKGEAQLDPLKVERLLPLYGVTGAAARAFLALLNEANRTGWWQPHHDVLPPGFAMQVSLESGAELIRGVETNVVPGLLQTPAYCRSLLRLGFPDASESEIDRRVELRMQRQERLLTRSLPPLLWLVMDESALARRCGSVQVMREQIEHLRVLARRPRISLQVIPISAGQYYGGTSPYAIYRFSVADFPDVVAVEGIAETIVREDTDVVETYRVSFENLVNFALSIDHTDAELVRIVKEHYS